jgi:hypothetical protein
MELELWSSYLFKFVAFLDTANEHMKIKYRVIG